jgi:hypothetical protein
MWLVIWLVQRRVKLELRPGDQVRMFAWGRRRIGKLIEPKRGVGYRGWILKLDQPQGKEIRSREYRLRPYVPADTSWLRPGRRVQIMAGLLFGRTGILIRPARLLWYRAWLLRLDQPIPGPMGREPA